jgi:hypothetical protein
MFPLVVGIFVLLGASVIDSNSSYLRLAPSKTAVLSGERFFIEIYANAKVPVNAIDIEIQFSPEMVNVVSVDKAQSVLTIWTEEPKIESNLITLSGGTFRRGFVGEHLIATIKAEAKKSGQTEFLINDAALLAGDGKGTPVAVTGIGGESKTNFYLEGEDPEQITAKIDFKISADIDGDGNVSLKDVSSFMSAWHNQTTKYDFNEDGRMNFVDFSIILAKSFFN